VVGLTNNEKSGTLVAPQTYYLSANLVADRIHHPRRTLTILALRRRILDGLVIELVPSFRIFPTALGGSSAGITDRIAVQKITFELRV
jgi:hypothetical protein